MTFDLIYRGLKIIILVFVVHCSFGQVTEPEYEKVSICDYYNQYSSAENIKNGMFQKNKQYCDRILKDTTFKLSYGVKNCLVTYSKLNDTTSLKKLSTRTGDRFRHWFVKNNFGNPAHHKYLEYDTTEVQKFIKEKNELFDPEYASPFIVIYIEDQAPRRVDDNQPSISSDVKRYLEKHNLTHLIKECRNLSWVELARSNERKIDSLITNNQLDLDKVGHYGRNGVYLTLLHSRIELLEKHQEFVKNNFPPRRYAYLVDKIQVAKKLPQIYGSQGQSSKQGTPEFYPIKDIENIDVRRKNVGLDPLGRYARELNINFIYPENMIPEGCENLPSFVVKKQ